MGSSSVKAHAPYGKNTMVGQKRATSNAAVRSSLFGRNVPPLLRQASLVRLVGLSRQKVQL